MYTAAHSARTKTSAVLGVRSGVSVGDRIGECPLEFLPQVRRVEFPGLDHLSPDDSGKPQIVALELLRWKPRWQRIFAKNIRGKYLARSCDTFRGASRPQQILNCAHSITTPR